MVDRFERLINLVIALRETRRPLTVEAINASVAGYQGERTDAWRRMFERDKAELRDMGVPIRTEPIGRFDDTIGYRIRAEEYDLPDIAFTPGELTALALAVELTGLGDDASPGLDKLAVDADALPSRSGNRAPLALGLDAPNRSTVVDALRARRRVRFDYAKPGGEGTERRVVEPHRLVHVNGRWYLTGHDRGRGESRTFRLDRIVGHVGMIGEADAFDPPEISTRPADVLPSAGDPGQVIDAEVHASPEVAWQVARRARGASRADDAAGGAPDGWSSFQVRVTDPEVFLAWMLELGDQVVVAGPSELRDAMAARLRAVIS